MKRTLELLTLLSWLACTILVGCGAESVSADPGGGDGDTEGDMDGDTDADADTDSDTDTDTDSDSDADSPLRIEAECAWGADKGDCNGAVTGGFNANLPGRDGADSIPLLKEGEQVVGYFFAGSWLAFPGLDLSGYTRVTANVASANTGGSFQVRLDSPAGQLIATISVPNTGSWTGFQNVTAALQGVSGVHTVYLVSTDNGTYNGDVDWIEFSTGDVPLDTDTGTGQDTDTGTGQDTDTGPKPHHKFVGNITTYGQVRSDFKDFWDQITPENEGKWSSVEGTRDRYNWSGVDAAYNYAKDNNLLFKQHTFVWGAQSPGWISGLPAAEQREEIEEWIRDFCARYPDTDMIDVVNESTPGHQPAAYAQSAFGNDWIIEVFKLARTHCPNSILILNDYNVLTWNTDAFINMARPAVNAGVVDAIGCQAHGMEGWSLSDLERNLAKVEGLGLPIYISEYDVARTNDQEQLQIMQTQFPFFYERPSVVGITLWGYVVDRTWVEGSGLIHDDGRFRPAMTWLMNYLGR